MANSIKHIFFIIQGTQGNDVKRTNIPDIRVAYRFETWCYELNLVVEGVNKHKQKATN